ncbi:MAG TPA: glycosyltransferase family 39 protein [Hymenobacter sp.]|uniref:glycosyltransferase family 39 protein n=1 Tax=Hymenobacter sp. TaxID=1898978 RepID=UPI002ED948C4
MAFIDEQRYVTAMLGLRALGQGHGLEFLQAINSMGARPGDGLWRVFSGLGQAALLFACGLNPNAPPSLQVPQAFNVLVMALNAGLLYKIYRQWFSAGLAAVGVALYASLVNTNLYLRHLLPYDHSLFFFLLALWLLLTSAPRARLRRAGIVGVLSGLSVAVYPGYFMGAALLLVASFLRSPGTSGGAKPSGFVNGFGTVTAQLAALVGTLGLFEALAQVADTSYLASSRYIATTVTQGDFREGFSFIGTYFWEVEGVLGIALLLLFGAGWGLSLRLRPPVGFGHLSVFGLLSASFLVWLGYAVAVYFGHALVFYGRILHFFVPFVVLGSLVALQWLGDMTPSPRYVWVGCAAVASMHFTAFVLNYQAVDYPADVAYAHGIWDKRQATGYTITACEPRVMFYRLFGPRIRNQPTAATPRYELVNFAYLYPINGYQAPTLDARRVLISVPYFMKYAPYQFEGHNPRERALLQTNPFAFQIIEAY